MAEQRLPWARRWVLPTLLLAGLSLTTFWSLYGLDFVLADAWTPAASEGAFGRYLDFDPGSITDAISALAGVVAAVLGIVITVVSIVVQLSAARFAGIT